MEPNNPENNGVWISREEYERLRQAQTPTVAPQPTVGAQLLFEPVTSTPQPRRNIQIMVGIALAISVYVSLTTNVSRIFALLVSVLAALFIMFTLIEFIRGKSNDPLLAGKANYRSIYKGIGIIMLVVVGVPVLYFVGIWILLVSFFALGGGRGS